MTERKKCFCSSYSLSYFRHYDYSMNRMYVKFKNSWKPIGWICSRCLKHEFDEQYYIYLYRHMKRTVYVKFKKRWKRIGIFYYTKGKYGQEIRVFKLETKAWK